MAVANTLAYYNMDSYSSKNYSTGPRDVDVQYRLMWKSAKNISALLQNFRNTLFPQKLPRPLFAKFITPPIRPFALIKNSLLLNPVI
jgi:hypothetical protein